MKWLISKSKTVNLNVSNYDIDWNKKAPSKGAQAVKDFLYEHCRLDQIAEELCLPKSGKLRADFINFNKGFVIEFNGKQHEKYSKFMHGSELGFLASMKRDMKKREIAELNGLTLIEITDKDLPLTKKFFEQYEIYL